MRKIIFVLIAFVMFSINIYNVNAAYDKYLEPYKEFVELAEKVEVKYILDTEYVDEEGNPKNGMFKIEIRGLSEELKIRLLDKEEEWYYLRDAVDDVITINGVESGVKRIGIYYREYVTLLRTIRVNIPVYNYYSERMECQGISGDELDVCDPWYKYELNESTFLSKINKYNENQEKINSEKKNENKVVSFFNEVIEFLMDYFIYIIVGIILIVSITVFVIIRKKQYSLE